MSKKIVLAFLLAVAFIASGSAAMETYRNNKAEVRADLPFPPPCFPHEPCPGGGK